MLEHPILIRLLKFGGLISNQPIIKLLIVLSGQFDKTMECFHVYNYPSMSGGQVHMYPIMY